MQLTDSDLFRQKCYVGGEWVSTGDNSIDVTNPATGEILGCVPNFGADETRAAIEAASKALASWREQTGKERSAIMMQFYALIMEHQEDLAHLMTAEQGKPLAESRGEIAYAAAFIQWFSEEAKRVYGDLIPGHQRDRRIIVLKQPVGVVERG